MENSKLVAEFLSRLPPRTQVEIRDGLKALVTQIVVHAVNMERERIVKLMQESPPRDGAEAARLIEDFGPKKSARVAAGRKY